ncbi:MAG TPA: hypothetical protein VM029_05225, partial [Opitutaceae bacterium]|nr:hypothetical protein [Opitutaceae bacterium]
ALRAPRDDKSKKAMGDWYDIQGGSSSSRQRTSDWILHFVQNDKQQRSSAAERMTGLSFTAPQRLSGFR